MSWHRSAGFSGQVRPAWWRFRGSCAERWARGGRHRQRRQRRWPEGRLLPEPMQHVLPRREVRPVMTPRRPDARLATWRALGQRLGGDGGERQKAVANAGADQCRIHGGDQRGRRAPRITDSVANQRPGTGCCFLSPCQRRRSCARRLWCRRKAGPSSGLSMCSAAFVDCVCGAGARARRPSLQARPSRGSRCTWQ